MHLPVVLIFIWIQERQEFLMSTYISYLSITLVLDCYLHSYMCIQEVETTPAYPDICFAVDDFDSTFDAVVRFIHDSISCIFILYGLFFALVNSKKLFRSLIISCFTKSLFDTSLIF